MAARGARGGAGGRAVRPLGLVALVAKGDDRCGIQLFERSRNGAPEDVSAVHDQLSEWIRDVRPHTAKR